MPELVLVKAADCLPLRERILRPGQAPSAYNYPADGDPRAAHFGLRAGKQLVGVASLLPEPRSAKGPGGAGPEQWRLRGMAVDTDRRGQGLGRMLLQAVQAVTQQRGGGLWFTARVGVRPFYERYGCHAEGDVFDLPGGGPHVLMTWHPVGVARMRFGKAGTLPGTGEDDDEDSPRRKGKAAPAAAVPEEDAPEETEAKENDVEREPDAGLRPLREWRAVRIIGPLSAARRSSRSGGPRQAARAAPPSLGRPAAGCLRTPYPEWSTWW
jgi:GNAT superfamily N-acetyltransferase